MGPQNLWIKLRLVFREHLSSTVQGEGLSPRRQGKGLVVLLAVSPSSSSIYVI